MLPTHLMQPYGVSSQWPFSHFFASPTTPWPRPRALIQLATSVALTWSFPRMVQSFALSGLKLFSIETTFFLFHCQEFLARFCSLSALWCSILPWFLLQPPLPSSASYMMAPCIPWPTPSLPTQSSRSYPRLVYAPLLFRPTASDGVVPPLTFRLGYGSVSFSRTVTAALTPTDTTCPFLSVTEQWLLTWWPLDFPNPDVIWRFWH